MYNRFIAGRLVVIGQKFREYYNNELRQKYSELEPERKKYLKQFWLFLFLFVGCALIYAYFCYEGVIDKNTYSSEGFVKFYFVYGAIVYAVCSIPVTDFKRKTKFLVMNKILSFWGDIEYSSSKLISMQYVKNGALFGDFDRQEYDDAFRGSYHGAEISVSEQKLTKVIHTRKGKRDKTVFKGILVALKLDKQSCCQTLVYGKGGIKNFCYYNWYELLLILVSFIPFVAAISATCFWGFSLKKSVFFLPLIVLGSVYSIIFFFIIKQIVGNKIEKNQKRVLLEDVVFSEKWKVFADDQVEARYILTPALMERMLLVKRLFHGNRLDFSFWTDNLLIAIHTSKDMFETTSLFKSALDYQKVQEVICQLYSIFSVIDTLKLSNKKREL